MIVKKTFTLTEVLMAMGAFLFACSILFGVLMSTTKMNVDTVRFKQAGIIAQRELARIQEAALNDDLTIQKRVRAKDRDFSGIEYEITCNPMYNNTLAHYELTIFLPSGNQHYSVMVTKR